MNTLKLKRIQQIVAAAGIALAALMYTGCMVTPGDGENLTNRSDTVEVYGYAANPNESIEIQARRPFGTWSTVATVDSVGTGSDFFGVDIYSYVADITVPNHLWQVTLGKAGLSYRTEVRALDSTGNALVTYEDGFDTYFWDYDFTLEGIIQMTQDHGAGDTVTLTSDN
jgi:hypothetical protein